MASDQPDGDDRADGVSRREALRFVGTAAVSAATLGALSNTASAAPNGEFGTVVDLGAEGLSSGDEIDPYIAEYFVSGNEVHIPPGEYEWNGTLEGPSSGDAALVGDGDIGDVVFRVNSTLTGEFAHDSGTVLFHNVTFSGANPEPKAGITFAVGDGGTLRFEHIRAPDGASQEEDRFLYADSEHTGEAFVRNCYWQGFGNNGAYTDNGRVVYENCVSHNNNIAGMRIGIGDSEVYNSLIIIDGEVPTDGQNSANARGIRVREPGNHVIENCDFVYRDVSGAGSPVELRASETAGVLRNCRVLNETDQPVVRNKSDNADWTAEDIHLSGSGNLEMEGVDTSNVTRGDGATPPRTNFEEFLGAPIDAGTSEPATGNDSEPTPDDYENNVVLHASPDNQEAVPSVSLTVSGEAAFGSDAESDTDTLESGDEGTTLTSVGLDPDALDSFLFDGEVTDYSLPDGYAVDVSLNGTMTTFAELVGEEPTDTQDDSTDEGSDSAAEQHELRLTASADNDGDVPEAAVTVSGDAEYGPESETDEDRIAENDDGTTTIASVALDPEAVDSFLFTGEVVDASVSSGYNISVAIDGESTTFDELVEGTTGGATDDGSSDDGSTDDGSTDGGSTDDSSTDDSETDDSSDGSDDSTDEATDSDDSTEELPNELVVDSTDADTVTAYTVTVSGDVVKDNANSPEGGLFDRFDDVARDGKVIGLVHDGTDVYRYSGSVTEVTVDGNADVSFRGV